MEAKKEEIVEYQKPESPTLMNAKVQSVELKEDEKIDKEPENKKRVELQLKKSSSNVDKELERIDNSFERGTGKLKLEDLAELERNIEQDDISPINRSESEAEKQRKNAEKVATAALRFS